MSTQRNFFFFFNPFFLSRSAASKSELNKNCIKNSAVDNTKLIGRAMRYARKTVSFRNS